MWDVELAKQFKERDNKRGIGPIIGDVINVNPLKVSVLSNKVLLTNENSYICSKVTVNAGEQVLCIPTNDGQTFFIVDKVVR